MQHLSWKGAFSGAKGNRGKERKSAAELGTREGASSAGLIGIGKEEGESAVGHKGLEGVKVGYWQSPGSTQTKWV